MLDLWLMVVVCAYAIEIYLVSFPASLSTAPAGMPAGFLGSWPAFLCSLFYCTR